MREAFRLGLIEDGQAGMLMIQDRNLTDHTHNRVTADAIARRIVNIYLLCYQALMIRLKQRLLHVLLSHPHLEAVWLFGSRAIGRHRPGSDLDLCLEGRQLTHSDRLELMVAIDDLLLPELEAHVQRVGRCLWRRASG